MKKIADIYNLINPLKEGDIIEGKIIGKEGISLFVDLGPQGTGIIRGPEFSEAKVRIKDLDAGKEVLAKVLETDTDDGYIELSLRDAQKEIVWKELIQKKDAGETIEVKILGANKGGLLTNLYGVPAFLPVSQLSSQHYPKVEQGDPQKILQELQKFIGQTMEAKILNLDAEQSQIILSEKLKELEEKKESLKKYNIGDVVDGEVTAICDFGVFIKFPTGGNKEEAEDTLEGLIHISELDWQLVENPSEIVKAGEKTKAKIIQINGDKVFLSLKALKENPWLEIEKEFKKGDIIRGKVKKLNPYGAFVELKPKIQGLCHISVFGSQKKMGEKIEIGKTYSFKISLIDSLKYKINLEFIEA